MTNYRSYRIVDGKPRWVIVDEYGNIINNEPSNEDIKGLKKEKYIKNIVEKKIYYNETNTCPNIIDGKICGRPLIPGKARRETDKYGKLTGRWICGNCWAIFYQKNDPNSDRNIIKSLRDHRTGDLDQNCPSFKGDLFEELTCTWRRIKNLNIENDNYKSPIDHSVDPELGVVQTKGRFYNELYEWWNFSGLEREWSKEFDNMICYCASEDRKIIERIYIFPREEIISRKGITIYKNPSRGNQWYERYRIKDKIILENINDIWKDIIKRLKDL